MIEYNFYFERSSNERVPLAQCDSLTDCWCVMQQFMDKHNYKHYYTRTWVNGNSEMVFDVGSWTEFFIWKIPDNVNMNKGIVMQLYEVKRPYN